MAMKKRILALLLSVGLVFSNVPQMAIPVKAEAISTQETTNLRSTDLTLDTFRSNAQEKMAADGENATYYDWDGTAQTFDGTAGIVDPNMTTVTKNLKATTGGTIVFKVKANAKSGIIFGAGSTGANDGSNMVFGINNNSNDLRFFLRNNTGNRIKGTFSANIADGVYHTLAVTFNPTAAVATDKVKMVVDGGPNIYPTTTAFTNPNCWFSECPAAITTEGWVTGIGGQNFGTAFDDIGSNQYFNGNIDFITITPDVLTVEEMQAVTSGTKNTKSEITSTMTASGSKNTWLYVGADATVYDIAKLKGARNYVGSFEDSLRASGTYVERSRYVFNAARPDLTVAEMNAQYETLIKPYNCKTIGISIDRSDYTKGIAGIDAFKSNLTQLISKIDADGNYAFVITPIPSADTAETAQITAYSNAVKEVTACFVDASSIAVNTTNFDSDNELTARGHQALANLIKTTFSLGAAQNHEFAYNVEDTVVAIEAEATISATNNSISVVAPAAVSSTWDYELEYNGQVMSKENVGSTFTISDLPASTTFTITLTQHTATNGVKYQLFPYTITTTAGATASVADFDDGNEARVEELVGIMGRQEPATWLFMGDSITHGVVTRGYCSVPELFKSYLNERGRTDDMVLNAGVTNATLSTTLDQIDHRLNQYDPDVVMVMLGTNDSSVNGEYINDDGSVTRNSAVGFNAAMYKQLYEDLVQKIYENNSNSFIILRVPCFMTVDSAHAGYQAYFDSIKEVASEMKERHSDLKIMVVDHCQEWKDYMANERNDILNVDTAGTGSGWLVDTVHPNLRGNVAMFQQILKETGLYSNRYITSNLTPTVGAWTGTSTINISGAKNSGAKTISVEMGQFSSYTNGVSKVTVSITKEGTTISKTADYSAAGSVVISDIDPTAVYTLNVTGKDAVNGKEITFASSISNEAPIQVTFDPTEGAFTDNSEATKSVTAGNPIGELPTPERAGYTFSGWFTAKTNGTKITDATPVTSAITYYAQWIKTQEYTQITSGLTATAGSEHANQPASNALDGVTTTHWHTNWSPNDVNIANNQNNEFTINLGENYVVGKFGYLPRQGVEDADSGVANGRITGFKLFYSTTTDGDDFTELDLSTNTWDDDQTEKEVVFTPVNMRRIQIRATETAGAGAQQNMFVSAAEFKVYRTADSTPDVDPVSYTVTFDVNGGEGGNTTRRVEANQAVGSLTTPTRVGYTFAGWFTTAAQTGGTQINQNTTISADITFYARWTQQASNNITITLNPLGGELTETTKTITKGSAVGTLPNPTRSGYTFVGWFTDENAGVKVLATAKPETDVTYYARWDQDMVLYRIDFNGNGGSTETTFKNIIAGQPVGALPTATQTGFVFKGWYTLAEGGTKVEEGTTPTGNTTYYAQWTEISIASYTVTFDGNQGSSSEASRTVVAGEAVGTLPTATRSGYTFDGWFTAATGGTKVEATTTITQDVNFYAQWTEISIASYTVTFDGNQGSSSEASRTVVAGEAVGTLPTATRSGYTFLGWFTAATGGTQITTSTIPEANVTYYAQWQVQQVTPGPAPIVPVPVVPSVTTYTVTFDGNGGTASSASADINSGEAVGTLPTATRAGYDFVGWFTEATGGTQVTADTKVTAAMTVYAQWTESTGGGSQTQITKKKTAGKSAIITWNKVKKATEYQIFMKTGKGDYELVKTVAGSKAKYTIAGLKAGKNYKFRVTASTGKNAKKKVTYGKSVTMTYKNVSGFAGYDVQLKIGKGEYESVKEVTKGGTITYTVKNAKVGKKHTFRLRGYNTIDGEKVYTVLK